MSEEVVGKVDSDSVEDETGSVDESLESVIDGVDSIDSDADDSDEPELTDLDQAQIDVADAVDRLTRVQAEMANLRNRTARDVEKAHKFALEPFAKELLAVADSIELGLNAAKDSEDISSIIEGMDLTKKQLFGIFDKFNVEVLDAQGVKFDPEQHEAMTMVPNPDMEPNTVMDVIQKGYNLNGRLLRPARVIVSS
ncbi:MAG: nucleotide exchange factor GrpE [Thiotrichales bacterium]|jgi:molecular chaperone GrpE|nr:nucleotide exchange factor GrpE [Thiotrichales bacterium]MBT3613207.1 nucleotide exchange factor GrpE [Thiotrichales bacterium]MBT3751779.1 nucleotide exchange factor GrpE [Thiotrichales bacterium]MBT3837936.1 nucleotide exchange factor GrpE [Thiotrichales bacterium]MBT4151519.1 nucleotide exchange factor GrpE [Thiotrichales bacterium]